MYVVALKSHRDNLQLDCGKSISNIDLNVC